MHTIGKDGDGTWYVARVEVDSGTSCVQMLFKGMYFPSALLLCNVLNGGVYAMDALDIQQWERKSA